VFLVSLHVQSMIGFDSVGTTFNDFKPVPLCDPSHNGCFLLKPHVHQEYGLSFTASNLMGALPARTGVCTASERARRKATLGARKRCMARTHRVYDDRESDARRTKQNFQENVCEYTYETVS
jgi:hypothetical protein